MTLIDRLFNTLNEIKVLLSEIASVLDFKGEIGNDREIGWLLTDSRRLTFPGESLFVALVTPVNNGHRYIRELYDRGVRVFVVREDVAGEADMPGACFLRVDDTLPALQLIAAAHRKKFSMPVIGITGSNGKTVVKEWLFQLLQKDFQIVRSPRSYNSQIGVPLSVWQLKPDTQLGIFEAGISRPGEMQFLEPVIRPEIGVFTNIGEAHGENFISTDQKIAEKLRLFENVEYLIYCSDDGSVSNKIKESGIKARLITWGKSGNPDILLESVEKSDGGTYLRVCVQKVHFTLYIPFTDAASIENAMHCVALMIHFGYSMDLINARLASLEAVAMRLEVKTGVRDCLLINDSYNSDLNSLGIALDFLEQQALAKSLKKTLILSDILQSASLSGALYEKVATLIKAKKIDRLIGIGKEISKAASAFDGLECLFFHDTEDFLNTGIADNFTHEAVLLKGSRRFHFEFISDKLELIAHETTLEVNLNYLVDNLNYFRSKLKPETKMVCMVKAFAYGSGSVEVARVLQHHRVDYLAVAVADEGAELRRAGITTPIIVMNPEKSAFSVLFENHLEPEIYGFKLLSDFMTAAGKLALTDYPVHIKIDSGMHRLGFVPEEVDALIAFLKQQNQVIVRSVFSHLAGADSVSLDYFTLQQVDAFGKCAEKISAAFSHHILKHILNSAGIERFPQYQFDMVRLGIGHYGISSLPDVHLEQVCALKTVVLQVKRIHKGETVGYNRNGLAVQDTTIAILPVGYADGFDRKLGNGVGEVFIRGERAKVIGNVSMDLITVDVTGLEVEEGDSVEIFGKNISLSEVAEKIDTIPYEILTGISRRVKRVYFQE